ncbi:PREDICTED: nucleoporin-like protein 2 [Elephantulus edwardii]|uniref:nucleoporin-like protein 2 n=1 Tax=Elephantulus edwardii TaxID=28737 RepID=UPI0003F08ECD|nr:PREDICTED: nucleoporin-like protein 2 [Elephantulus edwardii]
MAICQFFLQGRCRFGDRCWNEHPRAGSAGGARKQPQQQASGSTRRWNDGNQRSSSVIQPSSFSKSPPLGGSRDQVTPSGSTLGSGTSSSSSGDLRLSQSSLTSLNSDEQKDEKKLIEGTIKDMEVWESSGQWMFSVYSPVKNKPNVSGFTDISPEELRLQYHNFLTSNNLQSYLNFVQQLINQWRHRVNELKTLNTSANVTLLSDRKVSQPASAFGFGSRQGSAFESAGFPVNNSVRDNAQNFSFKLSSENSSAFGSQSAFGAAPSANPAITTSTPAFGFGKTEGTSASLFSFKIPAPSGFGSPGFSAFPSTLAPGSIGAPAAPGFGSGTSGGGFGNPASHPNAGFSKPSNKVFGNSSIAASLPISSGSIKTDNMLFTPKDQLTAEELKQFQCRKFTLGKIPLKPPPLELLNI